MAEQKDLHHTLAPGSKRRQQEDVGIILWDGIVGGQFNGPENVNDVVTVSTANCCDLGGIHS